jgi:hypothetical protein
MIPKSGHLVWLHRSLVREIFQKVAKIEFEIQFAVSKMILRLWHLSRSFAKLTNFTF